MDKAHQWLHCLDSIVSVILISNDVDVNRIAFNHGSCTFLKLYVADDTFSLFLTPSTF